METKKSYFEINKIKYLYYIIFIHIPFKNKYKQYAFIFIISDLNEYPK